MGAVYAAHDPQLDRTVALKIVHSPGERARSPEASLKDEAQSLARLSHPNVVAVHDVGELPDGLFIAMEYVDGQTLRKWAQAHRDDVRALNAVMRDAGRGLAAAHQRGLIHLDVKPDNVMIADDGRVLVLDFGLAQPQDRTSTGTDVAPAGTPAYMAPEQHAREPVDARTDQFGFCVTWLECLIGRRPFPGTSPSAIARSVIAGELDLPQRPPAMPRDAWQAVVRGVSGDPEERWPSMDALLAATAPASGSKGRTVAVVVAAAAIGGAVTWAFSEVDARCIDAAAGVSKVWSRSEAALLAERAVGPDAPLSAARADQVVARLDAYATTLAQGYQEACRVAADQMPRQVCLDSRLEQLRAVADVALHGRSAQTEYLFEALEDVHACRRADEEALYREVSDPVRAQSVLGGLAQGDALLKAGRHEDAQQQLATVVQEAHALGWQGVEALGRVSLGEVAGIRGQTQRMHEELDLALQLAAAAGSDEATIRALGARLQEYAMAGDATSVDALAPAVMAAARRAGRGGANVALARGNALQFTGDYDASEVAYREALALAETESVRLGAQSNLGALALYRGKYLDAKALFEQATPASEAEHGPSAVATLKIVANLADADQQLGHAEDARVRYEATLQRYAEVGSGDSRPAEHVKLNYALLLLSLSATDDAERVGEPAARRMIALHGESHVFSLGARDFLNSLAMARGKHAEAMAASRALRADMVAVLGDQAPILGFIDLQIAKAALALGVPGEGVQALESAEPLFGSLEPSHPALVSVFRLRSELLREAGDLDASVSAGQEAVARGVDENVHPVERGLASLALAEARLAQGASVDEVRETLRAAAAGFAELPRHADARGDRVAALLEH